MKRQPDSEVEALLDTFGTESVNLSAAQIGTRIRLARKKLGLTQDRLAALAGATSNRGLQDNEAGKSIPGGQMIGALVAAGVNANWLLSGEGEMLRLKIRPDIKPETETATAGRYPLSGGASIFTDFLTQGAPDQNRLKLALQAVEEGLAAANRTMAADKKAELVIAAYDLFGESSASKESVLKLVKLAA